MNVRIRAEYFPVTEDTLAKTGKNCRKMLLQLLRQFVSVILYSYTRSAAQPALSSALRICRRCTLL